MQPQATERSARSLKRKRAAAAKCLVGQTDNCFAFVFSIPGTPQVATSMQPQATERSARSQAESFVERPRRRAFAAAVNALLQITRSDNNQ